MLAPGMVREIRDQLAGGELSQGEIARRWGVSRGTVNAIATGRRTARRARPPIDKEHSCMRGPPQRCPGCGGLVLMPCLACRVRARQQKERERLRNSRAARYSPEMPKRAVENGLCPVPRARLAFVRARPDAGSL